ncbi:hypothetical protein GQ43DRAFT_70119 [Delitschia confertaspora ATCC 74209]|uniref:DUF7587 domain-containing protein n=1 Tax=Delitschia confertaspora ATCC 74209 TaxID=1513339 RepID=A0A9P4JJI1_9PLEO|nr:hypothetical protein GQ43DRAFT_70119 [Delitschia confertaspora ATCC 74209]
MQAPRSRHEPTPTAVPRTVYRVDYMSSQTTFNKTDGFRARNQTTIINTPSTLQKYAMPHLAWQTNFSSPFISVFADKQHAERWARTFAEKNGDKCYVVSVDTTKLARGPIFRAADLLADVELSPAEESMHFSEYLVLHRIPGMALIEEIIVSAEVNSTWQSLGLC